MHPPLPLLLLLPLLPSISNALTLPCPSQQNKPPQHPLNLPYLQSLRNLTTNLLTNNTNPDPFPAGMYCGLPTDHSLHPTSPPACALSIDYVLTRDYGISPYTEQFWSPSPYTASTHHVPDEWTVEGGDHEGPACRVFVDAAQDYNSDRFRLIDVASLAQRVVNVCLIQRGSRIGGIGQLGEEGFFVVVDGLVG